MQNTLFSPRHAASAVAIYGLFNPLPVGFFTAAWIFDLIYLSSFNSLWTLAAAWLISFGLVLAIIPRLINLVYVWKGGFAALSAPKVDFWLSAAAVVLAIINAFVHSRDAYAVVPQGVILSTLVVLLLSIANIQTALRSRLKAGV